MFYLYLKKNKLHRKWVAVQSVIPELYNNDRKQYVTL